MLTAARATEFAEEWIAAWNSRDIERIVAHWAEDCVFSSPYIVRIVGDPSGRVHGKTALRAYWERALAMIPTLHFELDGVLVGADSLVIRFRNDRGNACAEWVRIGPDGLAIEGAGHREGGF
jgi:limonene-1,2-epoxide hydrolase